MKVCSVNQLASSRRRIERHPIAPEGGRPHAVLLAHLHLRFETMVAGNDYTGPDAAESQGWIDGLFAGLTKEWVTYGASPNGPF